MTGSPLGHPALRDLVRAWVSEPPLGTASVAGRLHAVTERFGTRPAVSDLSSTIDHRTLADRVAATATALLESAGHHGPTMVGVSDPIGAAVGFLASSCAGRPVVPFDPRQGAEPLRMLALRTAATAVVLPEGAAAPSVDLPIIRLIEDRDAGPPRGPLRTHGWSPVVRITNTSGSTASPKLIGDRAAVMHGRTLPDLDGPRELERVASNVTAAGGFLTRLIQALLSGDLFIGFPMDSLPPATLLARLRAAGPTRLTVTPSVLRRLAHIHHAARGSGTDHALDSVREVWTIGEPLEWSDVAAARRLCGPGIRVRNSYGSTEAGIIAEHVVGPDVPIGEGTVPVGRPVSGRRVWISDGDGRRITDGSPGRIVVEGRFTTDGVELEPLSGGESRFLSNDLGRFDSDGTLQHHGRSDGTLKVAGTRVETSAIEAVLREAPGVIDVAVIAAPLALGEVRLIAHVVCDLPDLVDVAALRSWMRASVASVAIPIRFVLRTEALPLLASGKVDRVRLTG